MAYPTYEHWITSRRFWIDTLERVVRTTAQVTLAVLGAPLAMDATGVTIDVADGWQGKAVIIGTTAVLTFVTCLAGRTTGDPSTASLTSGTSNAPGR
jgi:hypothetical protein